jgi:hypothetical protein
MSKPKKKSDKGKQENQNILTEAERKALEKLYKNILAYFLGIKQLYLSKLETKRVELKNSRRKFII